MKRSHRILPLVILPVLCALGCSRDSQSAAEPASPSEAAPPSGAATAPAATAEAKADQGSADGRWRRQEGEKNKGLSAAEAQAASPGRPRPSPASAASPQGFGHGRGRLAAGPSGTLARGGDADDDLVGPPRPLTGAEPVTDRPQPAPDMYFTHYGTNPTIDTAEAPMSTFSVDVDTASYTMIRSFLERGELPAEAAVRVEEVVNAFDYGYQPPAEETFAVNAEAAPSPNREGYHLLHIGIKGREIESAARKPSNLVFVIDVSGSMSADNRLTLVKQSLRMLVGSLRPIDTVGIVVYGSEARDVLQPTSAANRHAIVAAIDALGVEGATNAEAGLRLGYQMAARNLKPGGVNRVVLCSDGVANVGMTGPSGLLDMVSRHKSQGITITTVGFGMGNYNDVLMEQLAQGGNGNYYYVDKLDEARRVFVERLSGTLQVIAKDVKIQLAFDPKAVARYRLVGYENRALKAQDFADDRVDAGEIGAGHAVTALYEVKLRPDAGSRALGALRIRYKAPDGDASRLIEKALPAEMVASATDSLSSPAQLSLAAAELGEKLRGSYWVRNLSYEDILRRIDAIRSPLREQAQVVELRRLTERARQLDRRPDKFLVHGPIAAMDFDRVPVLR